MILPSPRIPAPAALTLPPEPAPTLAILPAQSFLFPSLYRLLPRQDILPVLHDTGTAGHRLRRLPACDVVWLVIAQSWFADRSLPLVWRHLHPSSELPEPAPSAFTQARQRLGARPLRLLFHRVARPLADPALPHACHRGWRVVALDGTVVETPDTPANRRTFGSATNQHGPAAFPQVRLAALCEVGSHALTDVEIGPYAASEQVLGARLLRRLPRQCLVLVDRGLGYYPLIRAVLRRRGHVLARVKAKQRELPVERVLADGSYLSTIYPSSNDRRRKRGGLPVRVIRYTHDDPCRDGRGEESCLLTTILRPEVLSASEAIRLYPWRWEEESAFAEIKGTLWQNGQPLLRSKTPSLVLQEIYGALLGHYLIRQVMVGAAVSLGSCPTRVSLKRSLAVLEDRLREEAGSGWYGGLCREVGRQRLGPKRMRRYPRAKKATRAKWPNKKPGTPPPPQPTKPFDEVVRILLTDRH